MCNVILQESYKKDDAFMHILIQINIIIRQHNLNDYVAIVFFRGIKQLLQHF